MRCLIVDDSAVFIHAVCRLLEHQGIRVVGVASTSEEASRRFSELRPDVTLVDVELGDESGFDVAEQLHAIEPSAPLILVSTHGAEQFAEMVDESSAVGFISKTGLTSDAIPRSSGRLSGPGLRLLSVRMSDDCGSCCSSRLTFRGRTPRAQALPTTGR